MFHHAKAIPKAYQRALKMLLHEEVIRLAGSKWNSMFPLADKNLSECLMMMATVAQPLIESHLHSGERAKERMILFGCWLMIIMMVIETACVIESLTVDTLNLSIDELIQLYCQQELLIDMGRFQLAP